MRYGTTLQRLAEAQCNGDWPADNGERETAECEKCGSYWVPSVVKGGKCPDCRAVRLTHKALRETKFRPVFGGDPRGAVLVIVPVGASTEDVQSGLERGIAVP